MLESGALAIDEGDKAGKAVGPSRYRYVVRPESIAVQGEHRLGVLTALRDVIPVLHAPEVVLDDGENLKVMLQPLAVPLVPEVHLVHPVPALPHVDRLEAGVLVLEDRAPGVIVVDLIAERERIPRADEAN